MQRWVAFLALRFCAIVCDSCDSGECLRCKLLILLALVAVRLMRWGRKTVQEGGRGRWQFLFFVVAGCNFGCDF